MRLLSFQGTDGPAWGLQVAGGVVESRHLGADVPSSLMALLAQSGSTPHWAQLLPARAAGREAVPLHRI